MRNVMLLDSEVELDAEKTAQWYAQAGEWGCKCGHCANFLKLARSGMLPSRITEQLNALQIPPEKATYVCQLYEENGKHLYQFSYRVAGTILRAAEPEGTDARCCQETYPYGAPGFPDPHFDVEFFAQLPWVLGAEGCAT